jgi:hypothetical protein
LGIFPFHHTTQETFTRHCKSVRREYFTRG